MRQSVRFTIAYAAMIVVFAALLWGSYCVPSEWLRRNAIVSEQTIIGESGSLSSQFVFTRSDLFTDGLMINQAVTGLDSTDILRQTMKANMSRFDCDVEDSYEAWQGLYAALQRGDGYTVSYGRYWHGYLPFLRTALCITDLKGIRLFNTVVLWVLALAVAALMFRKTGLYSSLCFAAIIAVQLPFITPCLQYVGCTYIMMGAMLLFLLAPGLSRSYGNIYTVLFCVGGLTSWADLLSFPIVTLCYPLIVALLLRKDAAPASLCRAVGLSIVAWTAGYGLVWGTKLALATLLTDHNYLIEGIRQAIYRSVDVAEPGQNPRLAVYGISLLVLVVTATMAVIMWRSVRWKRILNKNLFLFLTGLIPVLWGLLVRNHTMVHILFTYRIYFVTLFAWSLYFWLTLRLISANDGKGDGPSAQA